MSKRNIRWTAQLWVNGYSLPEGDDVSYFASLKALGEYLQDQVNRAQRYGAGYGTEEAPGGGEALIWEGKVEDVTDVYPDKRAFLGPRGGVNFENC